jgi:hypothetical protein
MFRPSPGHLQGVYISLYIVVLLRHEQLSSYTIIKTTLYETLHQMHVSTTGFGLSNNINN